MVRDKKMNHKLVAIFAALLCIVLIVAVFLLVKSEGPDDMVIKTDYCDLYYPSRWESIVHVEKQGNTVKFSAKLEGKGTYPLFDITFNDAIGVYCNTILAKDDAVVDVYLKLYAIPTGDNLSQEDLELLSAMQEDVNYLIRKLPLAENMKPAEDQEKVPEDMEIHTPYGTFVYPGRWKPYLRVNERKNAVYSVEFYASVEDHPEQHLFDLCIGADLNGEYELAAAEAGVSVTLDLVRYPLELDDSWTQEQTDILHGMLDDAQLLVQDLPLAKRPESLGDDAILVETPYGQLCYPGSMKDVIRTEVAEHSVAFYGLVDGHPELHLYDVCFGENENTASGYVFDGKKYIAVSIQMQPDIREGYWSPEQTDAFYGMQETANHVLDLLELVQIMADPEMEDPLLIQTPYGQMRYPARWKDHVQIKQKQGKPYEVQVYGRSGEIPEQLLFTVAFGGREGIEITTIADAEGKAVNVYVRLEELQGEEGFDKDLLYAMQEDAIWMVESLEAVQTDF